MDEKMATGETDHLLSCDAKGQKDNKSPSSNIVKSPVPLPRRKKITPPSYEEASKFPIVVGSDERTFQFNQNTEEKKVASPSRHSQESSDLVSIQELDEKALLKLDKQEQTECKVVFENDPVEDGPQPEPQQDNLNLSREEQSTLLETVRRLQEEQSLLISKFEVHDSHLKTLLEKEPTIRQTLRRSKARMMAMRRGDATIAWPLPKDARSKGFADKDYLYVQIEQLYTNLCKMHLPGHGFQNVIKEPQQVDTTSQIDEDSDVYHDCFSTYSSPGNYYDVDSTLESLALMRENEELKEKIRQLEERMGQPKSAEPRYSRPWKFHCRQKSPNILDPNGNVHLRRSPSDPTNGLESAIVAGCPVQTHPGLGTVNPVEMTFEWYISNYSNKLEMESKGRELKTLSKPFYISHNGYLAQLEVYLNGNNSGHGKCMSVFLRIIKGSFDQHLHWPVRLCIVVVLVNQDASRQQSLKGGSEGFSEFEYRKPTGWSDDSCDCWGFVQFVSHSMIAQRNYIRNDSLLLQVKLKIV